MPAPRLHPHVSTLAGRKVWRPLTRPAPTVTAATTAQLISALNAQSPAIRVTGPIDPIELTDGMDIGQQRYIMLDTAAGASAQGFLFNRARRLTVCATDPAQRYPIGGMVDGVTANYDGDTKSGKGIFLDSTDCVMADFAGELSQSGVHRSFLFANRPGSSNTRCGFQNWRIWNTNDAWTPDWILFGCVGYSSLGTAHTFRNEDCWITDGYSRNAGDIWQITSQYQSAQWNGGAFHPGFQFAGVIGWTDLYADDGTCAMAENAIDLKAGSDDPLRPIVIEDCIFWGYRGKRKPGGIDDWGSAIVVHHNHPSYVTVRDVIAFDCGQGVAFQPSQDGGSSTGMLGEHNLIQANNSALRETYGFLAQNAGGGSHAILHNHIMNSDIAIGLDGTSGNYSRIDNAVSTGNRPGAQTITFEVPAPDDLLSGTGVLKTITGALLATADNDEDTIWEAGNEAPPGAGAGLVLPIVRYTTEDASYVATLAAANGLSPYSYSIVSRDDATATVSLVGDQLTVGRGDTYREVAVVVRATDANGQTSDGRVTIEFIRAEIPDQTWVASSEHEASTIDKVKDGDLSIDGGWVGRIESPATRVTATATWPVAHDIELIDRSYRLQATRQYDRTWEYLPEGGDPQDESDWVRIDSLGTISAVAPNSTWQSNSVAIPMAIGLRYIGTGNTDGNEWHGLQEVRIYGTPSEDPLTAPVCSLGTLSLAQGERRTFALAELGTLAASGGGDSLTVNADSVRVVPAEAGTAQWIGGELDVRASETYAGSIRVEYELVATGEA